MGYMEEIDYEKEKSELEKLLNESEEAKFAVTELKDEMAFKRQIIDAKKASGLTQNEIAFRLDMTEQEISRMEKEWSFTLDSLLRYANALGYTIDLKKK